jgi:hypothetical protein
MSKQWMQMKAKERNMERTEDNGEYFFIAADLRKSRSTRAERASWRKIRDRN